MEARRVRRFGMPRPTSQHPHNLLPTTHSPSTSPSTTLSCCSCSYKFWALNKPIFQLGRAHSHLLRAWFSIGAGFGLTALLAVSFLLLHELGRALNLLRSSLFSDLLLRLCSASVGDAGYAVVATVVSVAAHEFGHALAAASEGIEMEYVAVFTVGVLVPGALVAFDSEAMQALPCFSALRVYCAGIWHNAVLCAVCGLALLLLPVILFPFYTHGESPMVLDVPSVSPLSGYLSRGDAIVSVDGVRIHNVQEWMDMAAFLNDLSLKDSRHSLDGQRIGTVNSRKGYCVPDSIMIESHQMLMVDNQSSCSDGLTAFTIVPGSYKATLDDDYPRIFQKAYCLNAKEVVKLNKCGDGWPGTITNGSDSICSKDNACLSPVQVRGLVWIEVTYSRPYSLECLRVRRKYFADSSTSDSLESNCGGTFVFVGNVISMASSVKLTAYQPRWQFPLGTCLPDVLERILICTFQVSLTLALLNSLPVYYLDGESILESGLLHFTSLSPRKRGKVIHVCLLGGTLISILAFLRIVVYSL